MKMYGEGCNESFYYKPENYYMRDLTRFIEIWYCSTILVKVLNMNEYGLSINPRSKWTESSREAKVSVRELEILILHSEGKSNEEIAEILDIKYQTVKNMLYSLNKKLDATTNAQALMKAISEGLVKVNIQNKDERDLAEKIMWAIETELPGSEEDAGLINMIKKWRRERKAKSEQGGS